MEGEYFFRTKEEFEQMIADDALIEHACYVGNYYGTPRAYVEEQLALGRDVILEIEIQALCRLKSRFPDTLLLFVSTPDAETLKNRLIGRGTGKPGRGRKASFPCFRGGRGHREL